MKTKGVNVNPKCKMVTFDDCIKEIYTESQINLMNDKNKILVDLINARKEKDLTQKALGKLSGIKQPMVAKVESGTRNPSLETILKLLNSVGKTLKVVSR